MNADLDLHDWVLLAPQSLKRCKTCKRYAWWFGCRNEWRFDIPRPIFWQYVTWPEYFGVFDLKKMSKFVSTSVDKNGQYRHDRRGVIYFPMVPAPEFPKYQKPKREDDNAEL